jgi:hypothetical protein
VKGIFQNYKEGKGIVKTLMTTIEGGASNENRLALFLPLLEVLRKFMSSDIIFHHVVG